MASIDIGKLVQESIVTVGSTSGDLGEGGGTTTAGEINYESINEKLRETMLEAHPAAGAYLRTGGPAKGTTDDKLKQQAKGTQQGAAFGEKFQKQQSKEHLKSAMGKVKSHVKDVKRKGRNTAIAAAGAAGAAGAGAGAYMMNKARKAATASEQARAAAKDKLGSLGELGRSVKEKIAENPKAAAAAGVGAGLVGAGLAARKWAKGKKAKNAA